MTRLNGPSADRAWAALFAADAELATLRVLQQAEAALSAADVKRALAAGGVATAEIERAWSKVQRKLRAHESVVVEPGFRYRWTGSAPATSPAAALDCLAQGGIPAQRSASLVALVRAALPGSPADRPVSAEPAASSLIRALAELAIEVEELTVNEASARAMIHRVRAQVKRVGLQPIERAGEQSTMDRYRHEPIGSSIEDGTPVVVRRPGYVWKAPTGDVLLVRAVVQERT